MEETAENVQEKLAALKTCRLCQNETEIPKLVDLFSTIMYYGYQMDTQFDKLDHIITQLTTLQVACDDKLPQVVCSKCVSDLFRAKNFIEKCIKTDKILRSGITSQNCVTLIKDEEKIEPVPEIGSGPYTFCPPESDSINDEPIVKIEPSKKAEQIDNISLNGSDAFDLADDMMMSLPDIINEPKSIVENEKEADDKPRKKVKMKMKKKKMVKPVRSLERRYSSDTCLADIKSEIIKNQIDDSLVPKSENNEESNHKVEKGSDGKLRFICLTCGAALSSKQNWKVHQAIHQDDRPHACDQCDLKFKLKSHLNGHKRNVHNGEKNHFCSECGKGFFSIAQFKFHMMTHTKEYPHLCIHCGKRFAQRGNLKDHIKTHLGVKDVKCPYCPYITTSSNCLNSHVKGIHKNNKPMQCSECGLRFLYPSGLKRHLTIHTGVKEFQCDHCEKQFRTIEAYKEHSRVHTKEKPYKCRYCEKQCRTYNHRLVHERVHTGNRPYVCQVCKKGFTTNGNLKTHMKTHDKTFE